MNPGARLGEPRRPGRSPTIGTLGLRYGPELRRPARRERHSRPWPRAGAGAGARRSRGAVRVDRRPAGVDRSSRVHRRRRCGPRPRRAVEPASYGPPVGRPRPSGSSDQLPAPVPDPSAARSSPGAGRAGRRHQSGHPDAAPLPGRCRGRRCRQHRSLLAVPRPGSRRPTAPAAAASSAATGARWTSRRQVLPGQPAQQTRAARPGQIGWRVDVAGWRPASTATDHQRVQQRPRPCGPSRVQRQPAMLGRAHTAREPDEPAEPDQPPGVRRRPGPSSALRSAISAGVGVDPQRRRAAAAWCARR